MFSFPRFWLSFCYVLCSWFIPHLLLRARFAAYMYCICSGYFQYPSIRRYFNQWICPSNVPTTISSQISQCFTRIVFYRFSFLTIHCGSNWTVLNAICYQQSCINPSVFRMLLYVIHVHLHTLKQNHCNLCLHSAITTNIVSILCVPFGTFIVKMWVFCTVLYRDDWKWCALEIAM